MLQFQVIWLLVMANYQLAMLYALQVLKALVFCKLCLTHFFFLERFDSFVVHMRIFLSKVCFISFLCLWNNRIRSLFIQFLIKSKKKDIFSYILDYIIIVYFILMHFKHYIQHVSSSMVSHISIFPMLSIILMQRS